MKSDFQTVNIHADGHDEYGKELAPMDQGLRSKIKCDTTDTKPSSQTFVCLCVAMALPVMVWKWNAEEHRLSTPTHQNLAEPIDINTADWITLTQLKGIGPKLAYQIVADRKHFGPFKSVQDLQRVQGIGRLTLDQHRSRLTIGHDQLKHTAEEQ